MPHADPLPRRKRSRPLGFLARMILRFGMERPADAEPSTRRKSRRRPPGMAPALVEPPRGPLPLQGGAAAPLEFDSD